ncbi:MAG: TetR family transcriptional regulator [Alphaproteobacteria bacterium]|nr:TetR family transcriptional regulator [Alphaproteobacteria bacterium]
MATIDTRERLLDAAERLFAEDGYAAVSVRKITQAAGVNVASISYHFGSKDDLLLQVFLRRASDLNRERIEMLKAAEAAAGPDGRPDLDDVLRALVAPPIRWSQTPSSGFALYIQFMARCASDGPSPMRNILEKDVGHLQRFVPALERTLPDLTKVDVCWRLHFALGAMHHTLVHLKRLDTISEGACATDNVDEVIDQAVAFIRAGFLGVAAHSQSAAAD